VMAGRGARHRLLSAARGRIDDRQVALFSQAGDDRAGSLPDDAKVLSDTAEMVEPGVSEPIRRTLPSGVRR